MKRKLLFGAVCVLALSLIAGCGSNDSLFERAGLSLSESAGSEDTTSASIDVSAEKIINELPEMTGNNGISPITGLETDEGVLALRPIAVMVPNNASALPQYNIGKASVLYECDVEYDITRLMAIIEDWSTLERIGNVRSIRDYYVYWAMEYNPLIVHFGNIWYADEVLAKDEVNNINGVSDGAGAFYRTETETRIYEQTAYTSGAGIAVAAAGLGYDVKASGEKRESHFNFATDGEVTLNDYEDAKDAVMVDLRAVYTIDEPYFEYNPEEGLYYRFEYAAPHMDAASGEQLTFKNIIIQNTYREKRPDGQYLIYQCHDTTKDGYYITNGKAIHITWKKYGEFGKTMYFDDNGKNLVINPGKTMICIVGDEDKDNVVIQ